MAKRKASHQKILDFLYENPAAEYQVETIRKATKVRKANVDEALGELLAGPEPLVKFRTGGGEQWWGISKYGVATLEREAAQ